MLGTGQHKILTQYLEQCLAGRDGDLPIFTVDLQSQVNIVQWFRINLVSGVHL